MKQLAQLRKAGDGGTQSVADRRTDAAGETSLGLRAQGWKRPIICGFRYRKWR